MADSKIMIQGRWMKIIDNGDDTFSFASELTPSTSTIGNVGIVGSNASAFEQVTVDATAGGIGLTALTFGTKTKATIIVEVAQIRFKVDGVAAVTASAGMLADIGNVILLDTLADITAFRAIRTGGTSGVISVTYSD